VRVGGFEKFIKVYYGKRQDQGAEIGEKEGQKRGPKKRSEIGEFPLIY